LVVVVLVLLLVALAFSERVALVVVRATADELAVDEDVVDDREADAHRVLRRHRVGALIDDQLDRDDLAADWNDRERLRWVRRLEADARPLGRILRRGGRALVVAAAADEVERLAAGAARGDVERRRSATAVAAVAIVETELEGRGDGHVADALDLGTGRGAVRGEAVLREEQSGAPIAPLFRRGVVVGPVVVGQTHPVQPGRGDDPAARWRRGAARRGADEDGRDGPEVMVVVVGGGPIRGHEGDDREDTQDDEKTLHETPSRCEARSREVTRRALVRVAPLPGPTLRSH